MPLTDRERARRWAITWNKDPFHCVPVVTPEYPDSGRSIASPFHESYCEMRLRTLVEQHRDVDALDTDTNAEGCVLIVNGKDYNQLSKQCLAILDDLKNDREPSVTADCTLSSASGDAEEKVEVKKWHKPEQFGPYHMAYEEFRNSYHRKIKDAKAKVELQRKSGETAKLEDLKNLIECRTFRIIAKDSADVQVDPDDDDDKEALDKDNLDTADAIMSMFGIDPRGNEVAGDDDEDENISTLQPQSHWDDIYKKYEAIPGLDEDWIRLFFQSIIAKL